MWNDYTRASMQAFTHKKHKIDIFYEEHEDLLVYAKSSLLFHVSCGLACLKLNQEIVYFSVFSKSVSQY